MRNARRRRNRSGWTWCRWWAASLSCGLLGCAHVGESSHETETTAVRPAPQHFVSPFAYEWFVRAELLRAHGDLPAAIQGYRTVLADADDDPYVLARLATALDEHGEHASAQAALEQAQAVEPCAEAVWLSAAEIAVRAGAQDAALAAYERAESCAPWSPTAPLALARLLQAGGQPERASAVLARLQARALPASGAASAARLELALSAGDAAAALAAAQAWLRVEKAAAQPLRRTAELLLHQGHAELACQLLQTLPAQEAESAALRLRALLACGRFAQAQTLLATSDPETLGGLLATARAQLELGWAQPALALAEDALTQDPQDTQAQLVHAQALLALGQYVAAANSFGAIPRSSQASTEARVGLGLVLRAEGLAALADELEHGALTTAPAPDARAQ